MLYRLIITHRYFYNKTDSHITFSS